MRTTQNLFAKMISPEHLFDCWDQFKRGKNKRKDIQCFERHLEDNIFELESDLKTFKYEHQPYDRFQVNDPKQRAISKATVRDRLVHHVVYNALTEVFDKHFIHLSLASRIGKGIHFGITHLQRMIHQVSANGKKPCFALKMDIKRFFDTVDHQILKKLIRKKVYDDNALRLIDIIIDSFSKSEEKMVGIPLGNVTSQLFANIYLLVLDDFIKQTLREKYYLRYCDDFMILSNDPDHLKSLIESIGVFLKNTLRLELHPNKVFIRKFDHGIDFIGYVLFPGHSLLRAQTKRRMKKRLWNAYESFRDGTISSTTMDQQLQSYLGLLSHADEQILSTALKNSYWMRGNAA